MAELTVERLFSEPELSGSIPASVKFSPDGRLVSYLAGFDVQDLWAYDLESATTRILVESAALSTGRMLSEEEKARRERKRITQTGIVEYIWHPDGKSLLFPLEGVLYLYDIPSQKLDRLTGDDNFQTDVQFSPDGQHLSFVRERDIYVLDLDTSVERRLTTDGSDTVSNGLAEFIAQEEMHRYEGYWWSPDSSKIAFIQVDEGPVAVTQRYEIEAESFRVYDQRYPYAGTPNASVRVGMLDLKGSITWIDLDGGPGAYIARVNWLSDSRRLAIQLQSRSQQQLDLVIADSETSRVILTETSDTWINLNDHFRSLRLADHFVWGSERDGYCHLYRISTEGEILSRLTTGEWQVARVLAVDEDRNCIYFEGFADTPLERHLYVSSLDAPGTPERISSPGFSHSVEVAPGLSSYVDRYSAHDKPPALALASMDGTSKVHLYRNQLDSAHPFSPYLRSRGVTEFGSIDAEDGQALHYRLIRPSGQISVPCPLLLTVYGGPGVQLVTNEWLTPWHHFMSSRGYALLQLDNRGTANRGKTFENPIYRRLGAAEVTDQLRGVAYVSEYPFIDANRIGVFGHSYGGYMTLMLMATAPEVFKAGISVAPVTDWHLYDTHYTERYLGDPNENKDGYDKSSVFPFVDRIVGNLLLIHGMADDNVLFTNTTRLMKTLQEKNIQFDLMAYPGAKHGIAGRANNIHRYTMMTDFLERHLLNPP